MLFVSVEDGWRCLFRWRVVGVVCFSGGCLFWWWVLFASVEVGGCFVSVEGGGRCCLFRWWVVGVVCFGRGWWALFVSVVGGGRCFVFGDGFGWALLFVSVVVVVSVLSWIYGNFTVCRGSVHGSCLELKLRVLRGRFRTDFPHPTEQFSFFFIVSF